MYRRAKQAARSRYDTIEFEYRKLYSLPETDPRYLDMTIEGMLTDIFAHRFANDPKSLQEDEDEDFDPSEVANLIGHGGNTQTDTTLPDDFEDL